MRPQMHITFLGGASAIGASCALVEVAGTRLLVDCGVRFRPDQPLPALSLLDDKRLDAILVTHAHSDHTGGLPVLCDAFPDVPVYATPPTVDLLALLYKDALKIMAMEGEVPLYAARQVERMGQQLRPFHHGEQKTIGEVEVRYLPASHILGASMVHLQTPAGSVLFTGDWSVTAQRSVPALARPALRADLVVTEATYGDRLHEDRALAEQRLLARIGQVLEGNGRVLVPAFAIGRAQEILLIVQQGQRTGALPEVPVFVDGMVRPVCDVYGQHPRYVTRAMQHALRSGHPFYRGPIQAVSSAQERQAVLQAGPCIIVASSGMLSGGASVFYAQDLVRRAQDAILVTGYQDEESPGRALLQLVRGEGRRELRLGEQLHEVRCQVEAYGLSAHADRMQMVGMLDALRPHTVVLVHGEEAAKKELARSLSCRDIVLAQDGSTVVRAYRARSSSPSAPLPVLDREAARRLVGWDTETPLRLARVADAYYGGKPSPEQQEQLLSQLEGLGVVRRDDERCTTLWVEPDPEEAPVAEAVRADNPKGKLLEYLARARRPPPRLQEMQGGGGLYISNLLLEDGTESGPHTASARKLAEQLAARTLLSMLAQADSALAAVAVSNEEVERLRATDPKSRLLEACARAHHPAPVFEERAVIDGFACRVGGSETQRSPWFRAQTARGAEQAAAAWLLEHAPPPAAPKAVAPQDLSPAVSSTDPRMRLNELRQRGQLRDFGYTAVRSEGPPHQPVFVMQGWATLADGQRLQTEELAAGSKKAAERELGALLYALVMAPEP
jgi:Cft2 family RNA processing exonuclease/dsRNA-specific ribonuclease